MKSRVSSIFPALGILCIATAAIPSSIRAQAPAGPLPAAQPQSSQPSAANTQNQQLQDENTSKGSGSRGGSGVSIAGFPIGGHGGSGGSRGGESDEERLRTQSAIAPANALTLGQRDPKNPEVELTEDQNRKVALFTDGRKIQKPDAKDDSPQEIAAHWDGSRLVTDEKGPHGGKMSRTFELSYDGTQLFETLRLTMGRSNTPLDIRYVYDPVSVSPSTSNQ